MPPSSDGGSEITHYIVERRLRGTYYWTERLVVHDTACVVNNLKEDQEYTFRVHAVNTAGFESDPSRASESFIAQMQLRKYRQGAEICQEPEFRHLKTSGEKPIDVYYLHKEFVITPICLLTY